MANINKTLYTMVGRNRRVLLQTENGIFTALGMFLEFFTHVNGAHPLAQLNHAATSRGGQLYDVYEGRGFWWWIKANEISGFLPRFFICRMVYP
jgi:hypothetical protein